MPETQAPRAGTRGLVPLAWLVVAIVIAAVVYDVSRRAGRMKTSADSAASLAEARPGRVVEAVVRLESTEGRGRYRGTVLEGIDDTHSRDTRQHLEIDVTPETAVVMGAGADVKPGAVVQVAGTVESVGTVRAKRLVILTGYIKVTPG